MKIYTRGGDTGETSLFGGERVRKNAPRVAAYGEVDELNSVLGVARAELGARRPAREARDDPVVALRPGRRARDPGHRRAQRARARPGRASRSATCVELEGWIDPLETELEPLRNFILPGGARAAALLHLGRTVCRRAERAVISLAEREAARPPAGPLPEPPVGFPVRAGARRESPRGSRRAAVDRARAMNAAECAKLLVSIGAVEVRTDPATVVHLGVGRARADLLRQPGRDLVPRRARAASRPSLADVDPHARTPTRR